MKTREISERLKGRADPEVVYVLCAIAEQQSAHRQQLTEMALQIDRMADIVVQFSDIAGNMKNTVDQMKKGDAPPGSEDINFGGT